MTDGGRDRDHAQHGRLKGVGGIGARRLAAVSDHDDAGDGVARAGARAGAAWSRLAARHPPSRRQRAAHRPPSAADLARLTVSGGWHTGPEEASVSDWELVLRGGRVIDPESGLDAVRDVAVGQGRIAAIGTALPAAPTDIDVAGQVVTAGFIDLHSHVSDLGGLRLQAMDGVTTALELEAGVTPVADAYRHAALQGRPVNYGFSASWALARMEAVAGLPPDASLGALMARISDPAWQRPAEAAQVTALLARLSADLADGALGIGVLLGYAPAASPAEYLRVAELAAEVGLPTFTHARDLIEMVPGAVIDGADEIVHAAAQTGAHMHYCHINSTSQRHIDRVLTLVGRAQAAGSQVTMEAYPYGSGMTGIGATFLAPERLGERGLLPSSLTYAPTGERVGSEAGDARPGRPVRAAPR